MYNSTIAIKQDKFKKEDFIIIRISKKRLGNRVWLHPKWWQQVGQKVHRGVTIEVDKWLLCIVIWSFIRIRQVRRYKRHLRKIRYVNPKLASWRIFSLLISILRCLAVDLSDFFHLVDKVSIKTKKCLKSAIWPLRIKINIF